MKKAVLLITLVTLTVFSSTSASAQVATTGSSLALQLTQGTPSGAAMLTSGGTIAASAAKVHVVVLPIFTQSSQTTLNTPVAAPFTVETNALTETTMAAELNTFIAQERALKQRGWFRKKK